MSEKNEQQVAQLGPNDLQLFESVSLTYDAVIPHGVEPERILAQDFWAHHAIKLRPMHEIRARAEDGTWIAYLVVLDCSRTWARVFLKELYRLTTADVSLTQASEAEVQNFIAAHEVRFNQGRKWHVIRKNDRTVIQDEIAEKDAATAWLEKHARTSVGAPASAPAPTLVAA